MANTIDDEAVTASSIIEINPNSYIYQFLPECKWLTYAKIAKNKDQKIDGNLMTNTSLNCAEVSHKPIDLMHLLYYTKEMQIQKIPVLILLNEHIFVSIPGTPVKWAIGTYPELFHYIKQTHNEMENYPYSLWIALKRLRCKIAQPVIKGGTKDGAMSATQFLCKNRGEFVTLYKYEPRLQELALYARHKLQQQYPVNNITIQGGDTGSLVTNTVGLNLNLPLIVVMESVSIILQVVLSHFLALAIGAKELPPIKHLEGGGIIYGPGGSLPVFDTATNQHVMKNFKIGKQNHIQLIGGAYGAPRDWLTNEAIDRNLKLYYSNMSRFHFYPTNYCNRIHAFLAGIQAYPHDRHFIVVNTAVVGTPGQHWIAIGYDRGILLQYDSGASLMPQPLIEALASILPSVKQVKVSAFSSQASRTECGIYCLLMAHYYALNDEDAFLALTIPDSICYGLRSEWYKLNCI